MARDKNGKEIRVGNYIFDEYSGEYGNVISVGEGDYDDIKVDYLEGEDYCPACEVEIIQTDPIDKVSVMGLFEWAC